MSGGRLEYVALFGVDHGTFGELHVAQLPEEQPRTAALISVGGPTVRTKKGHLEVPNEDAIGVWEQGDRTLFAVADSHWGYHASHDVIGRLEQGFAAGLPLPSEVSGVATLLQELARSEPVRRTDDASETTLLLAVVDRSRQVGYGASLGDSACFLLDRERRVSRVDDATSRYGSLTQPRSLSPERFFAFEFTLVPGLLVVCTDGVHECCYGRPERSIRPRHLAALAGAHGESAAGYARALGELALAGVDGEPGGEDNIALAVTELG